MDGVAPGSHAGSRDLQRGRGGVRGHGRWIEEKGAVFPKLENLWAHGLFPHPCRVFLDKFLLKQSAPISFVWKCVGVSENVICWIDLLVFRLVPERIHDKCVFVFQSNHVLDAD